MIRKAGLFLVMLGALSLSFAGQVETVRPLLGQNLVIVFALTTDLATLLALNEVTTTSKPAVRFWAWLVLLLAGGTALGLNTWHALQSQLLPKPVAVAVGAGPVVLAGLLSHLMVLVFTERREADQSGADSASQTVTESAPKATFETALNEPASATAHPGREAVGNTPQPGSTPVQPEREEVPARDSEDDATTDWETLPELAESSDETASEDVPAELIDRAERLERQRLTETDGKRGLPYREAPRRLGVRYETARAALDAARTRMNATDTDLIAA